MSAEADRLPEHWEPVIGLEVHVQLKTRTKMFCGCEFPYGDASNTHTCPTCLGLPGALPVVNRKAIRYALRLGVAIGGRIRTRCRFARKNYFYPDLTKGYQISQYDEPLIEGGSIPIWLDGELHTIPLIRIHLEEDAGKSIHAARGGTLVDFNRCGAPLVEIVSEPELYHPRQAHRYLERVQQIVQYLGISDANMEMGQLRCDANISLRTPGDRDLGTRTEMKNMNSFRSVERALGYEIRRQARLLDSGTPVEQCSLLWNEKQNRAEVMRLKEDAPDYRYFPDPDLVPLEIEDDLIAQARAGLPELPHQKEQRWVAECGLTLTEARILAADPALAAYFDATLEAGLAGPLAAKWVRGEILHLVKTYPGDWERFPIPAAALVEVVQAVEAGTINQNTGKEILSRLIGDSRSPSEIIAVEGLAQVSDPAQLESLVEAVLADHPGETARYREGEKRLFGFFMGQVMQRSAGKSNPALVHSLLEQKLS